MKYPIFTLDSNKNNTFIYAEYPDAIETGSFLQVKETSDSIAIKVDHFSTIPFYYVVFNKILYGSTKFKLLVNLLPKSFERKLNIEASIEFLRTNTMMADKTLLLGIKRITFGNILNFNKASGEFYEKEYWKLPGDTSRLSKEQILQDLEVTFLEAIKDAADKQRVGIHLSGGMDSRNIMGALLKQEIPFKTYTYGVKNNLDVQTAKILSKKLSLDSQFLNWDGVNSFKVNADLHFDLTDGMQSLIHGHGIEVHERQAAEVDTILYGHFLDFFIQGHIYNEEFSKKRSGTSNELLYKLFNGGPCSIIDGDIFEKEILTKAYQGTFRGSIEVEIKKLDYMTLEKQYDSLYFVHHGLRRLMPQVQSGAQYLDFKLPGLNEKYFNIAWSTPGEYRKDRKLQEELLRRLDSKMMEFPIVKNNKELSYMGSRRSKKLINRFKTRVRRSRFAFLLNEYDYYGKEMSEMANLHLFEFMKTEILAAELEKFGFLKKEFIDHLFESGKFSYGLSFYSTFYSLSKFINRYIDK